MELYDFAIYGYFSDIIGRVFFPPTDDAFTSIVESFLVFGGAFLFRPIGGILFGYIGDRLSRKKALELSIFLMAFPTLAMGCLPTYASVGWRATALLATVRLLQGLSVGGQLMSSVVFLVERHKKQEWGWYGSLAMTSANVGSLLGVTCAFGMRHHFTTDQLVEGGLWRAPFLCGVLVSGSGLYVKHKVKEHTNMSGPSSSANDGTGQSPLALAFSAEWRGSLIAAAAAVCLWAGGFYIVMVWLAIFMQDLVDPPVPHAFAINALNLLLTMVLLFPWAGRLSDALGRRRVMTAGAAGLALGAPPALELVARGGALGALAAHLLLGLLLCLYAAPLPAVLAESFPPAARLTAVALGYNAACAAAGGLAPAAATWLARGHGPAGAGCLLSALAVVSLIGVHCLAPRNGSAATGAGRT